jgi:hypothetical protein
MSLQAVAAIALEMLDGAAATDASRQFGRAS